MGQRNKLRLAGLLAGLTGGLFGGGGGMVLLPLLSRWGNLRPKQIFATSVAIIFPISAIAAAVHLFHTRPPLMEVLPYLAGGVAGGLVGGRTFQKVSVVWLKRIFALFLLYGGVRYLT